MRNIINFIEELRADNSNNYKLAVLKKYKYNKNVANFLLYTYNQNWNYYINKIPTFNPSEVQNNISFDDCLELFDSFKNKECRGNKGVEKLKELLNLCTESESEIIKLMIGRDIKSGISTTSINKIFDDLIPEVNYMGCQGFNSLAIQNIIREEGFVFSEIKSDGRYANCFVDKDNIDLFSRQGKPTYLNGKLLNDIRHLYDNKLPKDNLVLNGELVVKGYSRLQGNAIIAKVININEKILENNTKAVEKAINELEKIYKDSFSNLQDKISYVVWDIITKEEFDKGLGNIMRKDRVDYLRDIFSSQSLHSNIQRQVIKQCYNFTEVIDDLKEKLSEGLEGTIIKAPSSLWRTGKGVENKQFKGKIEFTVEMRVKGFKPGTPGTKYENTLGSLYLESEDGLICAYASGIEEVAKNKDFSRDFIWNNQDDFLDKVCEMKCNGLSINKEGGINFFYPNYVKMRFDKNVANTKDEIVQIEKDILNTLSELKVNKSNVKVSSSEIDMMALLNE